MVGHPWLSGESLPQAKLPRLAGGESGSGQGFPRRGSRPAVGKQETVVRLEEKNRETSSKRSVWWIREEHRIRLRSLASWKEAGGAGPALQMLPTTRCRTVISNERNRRESLAQKWVGLLPPRLLRLSESSSCVGYAGPSQAFCGASSLYHLLGRPGGCAGHGRPESPTLTR